MKQMLLFVLALWSGFALSADPRFAVERHAQSGAVVKFLAPKIDVDKLINQEWQALGQQLELVNVQGLEKSQAQIAKELNVLAGSVPEQLIHDGLQSAMAMNPVELRKFVEGSALFGDFKEKLKEFLLIFDPRVLAVEKDPIFFLKKQKATEILEKILAEARKQYPTSKELAFFEAFVKAMITRLQFEQVYAQNMLMIEIMENTQSTLQLTVEEKNSLMSSIYSSRVNLSNASVQKELKANWATKGVGFYQRMADTAQSKDRVLKGQTKAWTNVNPWFSKGEWEKGTYIVDLLHAPRLFRIGASVSHDFAKQDKIFALRLLLRAAEIGLSVITEIPAPIKSYGEKFIRSYYYEQIRLEGGLVATLEAQGDQALADLIWRQSFYLF